MDEIRSTVRQDIFECGLGGVKEWIDNSGTIRLRAVRPEGFVCGQSTKRDLSDATWMGEVVPMRIGQLREEAGSEFTKGEYMEIANLYANKNGTKPFERSWGEVDHDPDDVKINVLEIEFFSTTDMIFEKGVDKRGNRHVTRTSRKRAEKLAASSKKEFYPEVVYKAKWVIGTDFLYDYGMATDMKRKRSRLTETSTSYHMFAPNWDPYTRSATGYVEQAISAIDQLNLAWFRLQHVVATARPKGISIEMSSLENINIGKGGKSLTKR